MIYSTAQLGPIAVDDESTIEFPEGLPGFEECRRFAPLQHPAHPGLVFLQSLERPTLCFLAVPALAIRPDYRLSVSTEDLELIGFESAAQPLIGTDVVVLAILSLVEGEAPTANLLSPVVIHMRTRLAVQAIRPDQLYGCREPLVVEKRLTEQVEEVVCS
jgi:flagellar assembly factor FliW